MLKWFDFVAETANNTSTTDLTLSGAIAPQRTFASVYSDGDEVPYMVKDGVSGYEGGIGTYVAATNTITRDYVIFSSNSGSKINCSGSQEVRCVGFAEHMTLQRLKRPPLVAGLTTRLNGGTISDTPVGLQIAQTLTAANTNALAYAVTPIVRGGTSKFDFIIKLRKYFGIYGFVMPGMILRDSSGGSSLIMSMGSDSCDGYNKSHFNSDTSWNSTFAAFKFGMSCPNDWWMKLTDDNTNRTWYHSYDGNTWAQIYTEAKSVWASSADQVGVHINPNCAGGGNGSVQGKTGILECLSWELKSY